MNNASSAAQCDAAIGVVREFLAALDGAYDRMREAFATRVTDDFVWENIGWPPVQGKEAALATLDEVHRTMNLDHTVVEVLHALSDGGVVLTEQVEANFYSDGTPLGEPAMAMSGWSVRDGLVAAWRDYFDPREFLELAAASTSD